MDKDKDDILFKILGWLAGASLISMGIFLTIHLPALAPNDINYPQILLISTSCCGLGVFSIGLSYLSSNSVIGKNLMGAGLALTIVPLFLMPVI